MLTFKYVRFTIKFYEEYILFKNLKNQYVLVPSIFNFPT